MIRMKAGDDDSITRLIDRLKANDPDAAQQLWARYFDKIVEVARKRLGAVPRRVADEEDVALSVFQSLCEGAAGGRFDLLNDRDDLWRLLLTITRHKSADQIRRQARQKRGGGEVRGESVFAAGANDGELPGMNEIVGQEPTPEFLALVADECRRLLMDLGDDSLRQVAQLKLEGFTNEEIAERLDISVRTVERKLKLIREDWAQEQAT